MEEAMIEETPNETQAESAQILANEARERLQSRGHSDTEIREFADIYVSEEGMTPDVEEFIDWVMERPR